jgi:coenzyme F420-reducing hydrogenase delta subunit
MLSALGAGADGLLVLTCHEDNCHSRQGNRFARARAEQAAVFLKSSGAWAQRLMFRTLAANMAREFADIAAEFGSALHGLGNGKPTG